MVAAAVVASLSMMIIIVLPCHGFSYNMMPIPLQMSSSSSYTTYTTPSTIEATTKKSYNRTTAQEIVTQFLCPPNEELYAAGLEAFDEGGLGDGTIKCDDPRTEYTFDQFPLESFDSLIDRALDHVEQSSQHKTIVDLGSGCGRLVFYASLTRERWNVHGVEIGTQLHALAVNSLQRGVEKGWLIQSSSTNNNDLMEEEHLGDYSSKIQFHNANAILSQDPYYKSTTIQSSQDDEEDSYTSRSCIQSLLAKTSLIFAYSTVWETDPLQPFNEELGAMILSPKWSKTLASTCHNGCVAVTTDRALNPDDGWILVDRMDVENPSVWGSTGYISVLEK